MADEWVETMPRGRGSRSYANDINYCPSSGHLNFATHCFVAVSYTHLDVYKRQETKDSDSDRIICAAGSGATSARATQTARLLG